MTIHSLDIFFYWFGISLLFCHQATPIPSFTKTWLSGYSNLCKDTPETQCTILWEKRSGESVLWVLTAIPVVTLINWNCVLKWLLSKKWQEACFFSKTQILDQNCCWSEEKINQCVFLEGVRRELSCFHRWKILLLKSCLKSHVQKNRFPCSFRAV